MEISQVVLGRYTYSEEYCIYCLGTHEGLKALASEEEVDKFWLYCPSLPSMLDRKLDEAEKLRSLGVLLG